MCPACLSMWALVAAGATSAGGLAAAAVARVRAGGPATARDDREASTQTKSENGEER